MTTQRAYHISIFHTALALVAPMAHLFELTNKINLPAGEYLIVQQVYRGWALLGILPIAAIVSTFTLVVKTRFASKLFTAASVSLVCTQIIFWLFTFPVNKATENWTRLPENWMALRQQWEFSHATGAALTLFAFVLLLISAGDAKDLQ